MNLCFFRSSISYDNFLFNKNNQNIVIFLVPGEEKMNDSRTHTGVLFLCQGDMAAIFLQLDCFNAEL